MADTATVERWFAWYTRYLGRFLTRFDAFVTNGEELARRHRRRGLRVDAALPLGVERGQFAPTLRDERLRAALLAQCGLPPEGKLLLGVGRHHPEKRWPVVIDAVEAAGADMPVGLVLLGDGVAREALARRVAGSPHVRLFRPVTERRRFARIMASADALIHGADAEPFGLVPLEAVASGVPLIVPDRGGAADVAAPPCSERYRARDAASAAAAIRRLFAREPALLRRACLTAAAAARTDRDHAEALVAFYEALIAGDGAGSPAVLRA